MLSYSIQYSIFITPVPTIKDNVIEFHNLGITCKIISKTLNIRVSTVGSIGRKWNLPHTTQALPRQGHASKLDNDWWGKRQWGQQSLWSSLKKVSESGVKVHQTTISIAVHYWGLYESPQLYCLRRAIWKHKSDPWKIVWWDQARQFVWDKFQSTMSGAN